MKFTLTITDMTRGELTEIQHCLNAAKVSSDQPIAEEGTPVSQNVETPLPIPTSEGPHLNPAQFAVPTAPVENVELDKDGLPWDERIHASTKLQTAAGVWKKRKGVDKTLIPQVEAELRQRQLQLFPAAPVESDVPTVFPAAPVEPDAPTVPAAPGSILDSIIQTALNSQCRTDIDFDTMMSQVNVAIADVNNPVTPGDLPNICSSFSLQTLPQCQQNPEIIGKIYYVLGGQ